MNNKDYSIIGKILVSMIKKEVENRIDNCEVFVIDIQNDCTTEIGVGITRNDGKPNQKRYGFPFNFDTFYDEIERAKRFFNK